VPRCVDGLSRGFSLGLVHGTTFETAFWLKVEVKARPSAETGPIAGHFESAVGNEL